MTSKYGNLLFLLGAGSMVIPGCGDDGAEPERTTTVASATGASAGPTTTPDPTTSTTASPTTNDPNPEDESSTTVPDGPMGDGTDVEAVCQAYGQKVVECFPEEGSDPTNPAEACQDTMDYMESLSAECADEYLSYFACLGGLDCKTIVMKGRACAEEIAMAEDTCALLGTSGGR